MGLGVGERLGRPVGRAVGAPVGAGDGAGVGARVGLAVAPVGAAVGGQHEKYVAPSAAGQHCVPGRVANPNGTVHCEYSKQSPSVLGLSVGDAEGAALGANVGLSLGAGVLSQQLKYVAPSAAGQHAVAARNPAAVHRG